MRLAEKQNVLDRVEVAHADLGRVEWPGASDLAVEQAEFYGVPITKVSRTQGDLLQYAENWGMWPSPKQRWCTAGLKRDPINRIFTARSRERKDDVKRQKQLKELFDAIVPDSEDIRILNCMGMRAEESPARKKMQPFSFNKRASCSYRHVDNWLAIHGMSVKEVWSDIKKSGVKHHWAYDIGMPRLSCVICIFAPKNALLIAAKHNMDLLREYVRIEKKIGHRFRMDLSLEELLEEAENTELEGLIAEDWKM